MCRLGARRTSLPLLRDRILAQVGTGRRKQKAEGRKQKVETRRQKKEGGPWSVEKTGLGTAVLIQIYHLLPTAHCFLHSAFCFLLSAFCLPALGPSLRPLSSCEPIAVYEQLTTNNGPRTTDHFLPSAFYFLLSAFCLLPANDSLPH